MRWVPTDTDIRHLDYDNIFATGDCGTLSQPKLGHIAAIQGEVAASAIAHDLDVEIPVQAYKPEVVCIMNRGVSEATLIASDTLYDGEMDFAVSGAVPYTMK